MSEEDYIYKANKNRLLSEDDPTRLPTGKRRQFGYECKRRSDEKKIYTKAYRWLNNKVGSNWNNVWADICSKTAPKDKAQMFSLMKENIEWFIKSNCFKKEDGGIYTINRWGKEFRVDIEQTAWTFRNSYYVFENILRKTKVEKIKSESLPKVIKFLGNDYHKKDGIWFRVILKDIYKSPRWQLFPYIYDSLYKKTIGGTEAYKYYGQPVFCFKHFSINSKELSGLKKFLKSQT